MREVDDLLNNGEEIRQEGTLQALICPHAGYPYSGAVAAKGYAQLRKLEFDAVIVVGPSHREYFEGVSIALSDAYETPLGEVPIHKELRAGIINDSKGVVLSQLGHGSEHSIEVQLPFLQRVLKKFSFVPIIIGDQRRDFCESLSEVLATAASKYNVLMIASSDLSHYHPYQDALVLDNLILREVESFNARGLMDKLERNEVEACGGGPMVAVMLAAQKLGANRSRILAYCNSGDVTGDKEAVVGYLSAALTKVS